MSPIQQMLLGVGAVATKTYVDDVFSTYLFKGNATARSINNGVDLSGEGGLVWIKNRDATFSNRLYDTVRGATKHLKSDSNAAESTGGQTLTAFNSNGFSLGTDSMVNSNNDDTASWSFRKAPGFFDVKTWDGNSTAGRQISHDLGCVPGLIMVKSTNNTGDWMVYHRGVGNEYRLKLNSTTDKGSGTASWNDTTPTSTYVELGGNTGVNATGTSYVGYFFAGGESTAATARSVDFDGSGDYLEIDTSSDFAFGTGDYTIEFWMYKDATGQGNIYEGRDGGNTNRILFYVNSNNKLSTYINASQNNSSTTINPGQWYHCALSRQGSTNRMFLNGTLENSWSDSVDVAAPSGHLWIGQDDPGSNDFNGKISNLRVVKGTAVYTSSFKPPTEPLTNITNTKLLCCNNSSTTGSTVTPNTITANGSPTASTDSPFDDPAGFTFGDAGDQNVIKCGSYTTDSNEDATIDLGWEPQWVLAKRTDSSSGGPDWLIYDSMRGFMNAQDIEANNGGSKSLSPNLADSENDNSRLGLTSTGFYADQYGANRSFIYVAIRRPDGYVGKPPSLGTGVFNIAYGTSDSTIPKYPSGFVTDLTINRQPASVVSWRIQNRLTGTNRMYTDTTAAESTNSNVTWDFMNGHNKSTSDASTWLAWHWKRHAGFDVVAYKGDDRSGGRPISHNLSVTPEMMWIKVRDNSSQPWMVYHKDVGHGKDLKLNTSSDESNNIYYLNNTAPTSTHFTVGQADYVNGNYDYIAMLFASVDGISKVGSYTGDGVTNRIVSVGFNPRFLMVKRVDSTGDWYVLDTTRGFDKNLFINTTASQTGGQQAANTSASGGGFVMGSGSSLNVDTQEFIYYAHA